MSLSRPSTMVKNQRTTLIRLGTFSKSVITQLLLTTFSIMLKKQETKLKKQVVKLEEQSPMLRTLKIKRMISNVMMQNRNATTQKVILEVQKVVLMMLIRN